MKWLIGLALAALYLGFLNPVLDVKSFNAHDPASYLLGAASLWRGEGYGMRFADAFFPMKLQPPGLALLLSPIIGWFGMNFVAIKLFMVALAGLMAFACFAFFRYFLSSDHAAGVATLLLMASPVIFQLSHQVLAEVPLILCSVVALVSLDRFLRTSDQPRSPLLLVAAASSAAAYFFKGLGLSVLIGGWLLLLHPRWRTPRTFKRLALYTALVGVPIVLWQLRCLATPSVGFHGRSIADFYLLRDPYAAGSPRASLMDFLIRMRHNVVWGMAASITSAWVAPLYFIRYDADALACLLGLPVVGWLVWQWIRSCRQSFSVLEGFTAVGLLGLLLYIHGYAERYVAWLFPAFLVYGMRGFASLSGRWQKALPPLLVTAALASTVAVALDQRRDPYGSAVVRDYIAISQAAKASLPQDSRCFAPLESHWQILTQHQCVVREEGKTAEASSPSFDYAIVLVDPALGRSQPFKNFERDLVQATARITQRLNAEAPRLATMQENATFRLVRVVR